MKYTLAFLLVLLCALLPFFLSKAAKDYFAHRSLLNGRYMIEKCGDKQIPEKIREISEMGDVGIRLLTEMLGSSREVVASEAETILFQMMEEWKLLADEKAASNLEIIANTLSDSSLSWEGGSRKIVEKMVYRLVHWPFEKEIYQQRLLAHGVSLLEKLHSPKTVQMPMQRTLSSQAEEKPSESPFEMSDAILASLNEGLPGGGLRVQPASLEDDSFSEPDQNSDLDLSFPNPSTPQILPEIVQEDAQNIMSKETNEKGGESKEHSTSLVVEVENDSAITVYSTASIASLFAAFNGEDYEKIPFAEKELERRGWNQFDIEFGKKWYSASLERKVVLIDELKNYPSMNQTAWLLEISKDPAEEVRCKALGILATGQDPRIRREALKRAEADTHSKIRALTGRAGD